MTNPILQLGSNQEFFTIIREALKQGHQVKLTVSGNSMRPFLTDNRDQVILQGILNHRLKRGDIILYQRNNGQYILHRIQKKAGSGFQTVGDAGRSPKEPVNTGDILAKAVKIYRKGREIDCNAFRWRLLSGVWLAVLPFGDQILRLYQLPGRVRRRYTARSKFNRIREE